MFAFRGRHALGTAVLQFAAAAADFARGLSNESAAAAERVVGLRRTMITLRCTARAAKALGFHLMEHAPSGTSPLGDWYMNLVPTVHGGVFLFVNEQSLLSVFVPRHAMTSMNVFVARVGNILSMIGVPNERIHEEIEHFMEARAAKTASRKVIAVMNEMAARCQERVEAATPGSKVSISDFELELAMEPQSMLGFRTPAEVAIELLGSRAAHGAV